MIRFFQYSLQVCAIAALLFASAFNARSADAQDAAAKTTLSPDQWREDLKFFVDRLTNVHPNVFYSIPEKEFRAAVASLDSRIPSLTTDEIILEFMRINALVGDGHTNFYVPRHPYGKPQAGNRLTNPPKEPVTRFHLLPIQLNVYSDGMFISAGAGDNASLAGSRVMKIGKATADEALAAAGALVAYDRVARRGALSLERVKALEEKDETPRPGNPMGIKAVAPYYLTYSEVLKALHLIEDAAAVPLTLQTTDGKTIETTLKPMQPGADLKWTSARELAKSAVPLYMEDHENNFWFKHLPEHDAVFFKFNSVQNKKEERLAAFFDRLFQFIDEHNVHRLIIDMRDNGGGDNTLNRPLITGIIRHDAINKPENLFVITDRHTFSAASNCAIDLKIWTRAKFVGEPNGNSMHFYGDAVFYELPNSHLQGRVSALYWQQTWARDARLAIEPDIPAPLSSSDFRSGRDPALAAIFAECAPSEGKDGAKVTLSDLEKVF